MQLIKKHGSLFYWLALYAHCLFIFLQKYYYADLTKILLMPLLILYIYGQMAKRKLSKSLVIVYVAFAAAYMGDLFLLQDSTLSFMAGMLSFVVTHLAYGWSFLRMARITERKSTEFIITAVLLFIFSYKLYGFIAPSVNDKMLQYSILSYMILISLMAATAANLLAHTITRNLGMLFFLPGALLFILSDSVLAVNKYYFNEHFLRIVVMITYGYAQWLMAMGFTRYFKI